MKSHQFLIRVAADDSTPSQGLMQAVSNAVCNLGDGAEVTYLGAVDFDDLEIMQGVPYDEQQS